MCHTVRMAAITLLLLLTAALVAGCSAAQPTPAPVDAIPDERDSAPGLESLNLERVLTAQFAQHPTNMLFGTNEEFLVSMQAGRVWYFRQEALTTGDIFAPELIHLHDRVSSRSSEEGLLGLALDPNDGRHLYVYYSASNPQHSVVSRFDYHPHNPEIDRDSELIILEIEQPYPNHNGGQIAFGPDGYLYIGLGDGGSAGDPLGHGQNTSTLLGSILRIDVSNATEAQPYAIPPGNPFADGGGRPEIWAYGLRNPWRFSFDRETGQLWAGDVGQNQWEELDIIERGGNYGWNTLEGNHCFRPRDNCDHEGAIPPVWEYSLDGAPCSVIGGYVYRGEAIPWLQGAYVYGDFCSGKIYGLHYENGQVTEHKELADTGLRIMSFAEDNAGELYLLSQSEGIYRLTE